MRPRVWGPLVAAGLLAACGAPGSGELGYVEGFLGGVVVDEPRAALVGRDVLSAGGTAADAAVAAYFTMAVTLPGAAALGGGGVCLVHDFFDERTEVIDFPPAAARAGGVAGGLVPGSVRGIFALHARFGRQQWGDLLLPAERLARDGHAVSRALARELAMHRDRLAGDAAVLRAFGFDGTRPPDEGQIVHQVELGTVLAALRTRGPGDFYAGSLARRFVAATAALGWQLTLDDLREYRPKLAAPSTVADGRNTLYFTPAPSAGPMVGRIWQALTDDGRYRAAADDARPVLVAEAARRLAGASTPPPGAGAGASLVAIDREGQAVACAFTLGMAFGTGRTAPGTGILLAAPAAVGGATGAAAMMLVNEPTQFTYFAAAGSRHAAPGLAKLALDTLAAGNAVNDAIGLARLDGAGLPAGRLNAVHCPDGLPDSTACGFASDPRAFGLAAKSAE